MRLSDSSLRLRGCLLGPAGKRGGLKVPDEVECSASRPGHISLLCGQCPSTECRIGPAQTTDPPCCGLNAWMQDIPWHGWIQRCLLAEDPVVIQSAAASMPLGLPDDHPCVRQHVCRCWIGRPNRNVDQEAIHPGMQAGNLPRTGPECSWGCLQG